MDRDGRRAWINPDNGKTQDDACATCAIDPSDYEDYLYMSNFGLDDDIPVGASIDGIEVEIDIYTILANEMLDDVVKLVDADGNITGDNRASATYYPTSDTDTYISHGGAADMWGTALGRADLIDSDFGVVLSCYNEFMGQLTAACDHIRIKVYYTVGAAATYSGKMGNRGIMRGVMGR